MKKLKEVVITLIFPILFLIMWQILSIRIDNHMILPELQRVIGILLEPRQSLIGIGSLFWNIYISLMRVLIGYGMAIILGVPLGIMIGCSRKIEKLLSGFLNLFRPIPPLAWVPLVLAWFGIASIATVVGVTSGKLYTLLNNLKLSMLFIIFMGAFFPILTNTIFGIKGVQKTLVDSVLTLGANKWHVLLKVLLPASMPSILTGLKIGLGVAWMCLVSAEMLPGSIAGVGYLITHAYQVTRIDIVITGIVTISLIGIFFEGIFRFIEKKFFKWQSMSR
ncbi:MAG: ABC transporter permease [Clostridiaceae bacterium]|nr:ABC transporter permease [Clostridiaceae bacterium]